MLKQRFLSLLLLCLMLLSTAIGDTLHFPEGIPDIEEETFIDDTSLDAVVLPEGVLTIGPRAFARSSVKSMILPASLKSISEDAFDGVAGLQLRAASGSYAERWAIQHGYADDHNGIDLRLLIEDFRSAVGAPYSSPGTTDWSKIKTEGVDCSGLFVAAFRRQGFSIYHGTNTIWRNGSLNLKGTLTSAKQLFVGAAVFRWMDTDIPAKYEEDGEGNFYHIGLVVSTDPLQIIHTSSSRGVVIDTSWKDWQYWGRLSKINYAGYTGQ